MVLTLWGDERRGNADEYSRNIRMMEKKHCQKWL
jgi:hypothetical protein